MKNALKQKLDNALTLDPTISVSEEEIDQCTGSSESYMQELGLTRRDLKLLERDKIAVRAYLPSMAGNQIRWIIVHGKES